MIHRSAFSPFCLLPLLLVPVAPILDWNAYGIISAMFGTILFLTMVFVWYNIGYGFTEKGLFVKDGLSGERSLIDYSSIDRLEVRDGLALEMVAGMSYHRVAIFVNGKVRVQVSPKDREGFITELERRILLSKG